MAISAIKLKASCRTWFLVGLGFTCQWSCRCWSPLLLQEGWGQADCNWTQWKRPQPGILFFSPCLKSWRQLGFTAHSEFHLWGIWTAGSLAPAIRTILVQKHTGLLIRGWRPAKRTACWPQTNLRVVQLLKPVLKGKILGLTKKNLSNLSPQGG